MIYELWSGKTKIGELDLNVQQLMGSKMVFPVSDPKNIWRIKSHLEVPFQENYTRIDHCTYQVRTVLNVKRKSKNQIDYLLNNWGVE